MIKVRQLANRLSRCYRRFSKDHEWVDLPDKSTECSIGITDYAQNALGGVVYLSYPKIGEKFKSHEPMGEIESPKAVSQIYAPVSLQVTQVNNSLDNDLAQINSKADSTWLYKGTVLEKKEFDSLLTLEEYNKLIEKH